MKKDYIVELREEEADELMDDHWVGELVRCKDCKHHGEWSCAVCINELFETAGNWFCADGVKKDA